MRTGLPTLLLAVLAVGAKEAEAVNQTVAPETKNEFSQRANDFVLRRPFSHVPRARRCTLLSKLPEVSIPQLEIHILFIRSSIRAGSSIVDPTQQHPGQRGGCTKGYSRHQVLVTKSILKYDTRLEPTSL